MKKLKKNWHLHIEYSDLEKVLKYRATKERMIFKVVHIVAYAFLRNSAFKRLTLWREK